MRIPRPLVALAAAAALGSGALPAAQELDAWLYGGSPYDAEAFAIPTWGVVAPTPLGDAYGGWTGASRSWLALQPVPPPRESEVVEREDLDAAHELGLGFEELPGGVVLGLQARVDPALRGARIVVGDGGALALETGEARFLLPERSAAYLRACLAFARRSKPGDVAVDLTADGSVKLAPELVDTEPGAILVRADGVPHRRIGLVFSKSLLLDREVRLRAAPAEGMAWVEADLEVRFYRRDLPLSLSEPDGARRVTRRVVPWAGATPEAAVVGALAADLAPAAEVAGWIGLFRWAAAADPEGIEAVAAALDARAATSAVFVATPRRVDPAAGSAAPPGILPSPSPVADWMRAHRTRRTGAAAVPPAARTVE